MGMAFLDAIGGLTLRTGTFAAVLLALAACGPTIKPIERSTISANISGLVLDESKLPTQVYTRPGAPGFGAYKRFIIDPVSFNTRDPSIKDLDKEELAELKDHFRGVMLEELRDGGYEITTKPGPDTLRISFIIAGLETSGAGGAANVGTIAAGTLIGVPVIYTFAVGEVTVEAIFSDSQTNQINGVTVERSAGRRFFNATPWSTWSDVKANFTALAEETREAIDIAHGR